MRRGRRKPEPQCSTGQARPALASPPPAADQPRGRQATGADRRGRRKPEPQARPRFAATGGRANREAGRRRARGPGKQGGQANREAGRNRRATGDGRPGGTTSDAAGRRRGPGAGLFHRCREVERAAFLNDGSKMWVRPLHPSFTFLASSWPSENSLRSGKSTKVRDATHAPRQERRTCASKRPNPPDGPGRSS